MAQFMPVNRLRVALGISLSVVTASVLVTAAGPAPAATETAAAPAVSGPSARTSTLAPVPPALRPNARALKASHLIVTRDSSGNRVLRFESGLANVGRGPLEVRPNANRPCPPGKQHASQIIYRDQDRSGHFSRRHDKKITRNSAGCMVFHPRHDHWHFEAAARYVLYKPTRRQPVVVQGRKMSFCLRDSERAPKRWPTANYPEYYGDCARRTPQGISIGWVDIYQNFLPGQAIRLPDGLRAGLYCFRTVVDPQNQLVETHDDDNTSLRAFRLSGTHVTVRPDKPCRQQG